MTDQTFAIKGRLVPAHQIPIDTVDSETFDKQLQKTIEKAPQLFQHAPCVLDISKLPTDVELAELTPLIQACRQRQLVPFAFTSQHKAHQAFAHELAFAWFDPKTKANKPKTAHSPTFDTQVTTTPVRSGQQIYAKGANLLVTSQVSAGAEIIADGSIHVLGALRGRAIAGASGDTSSVIVAKDMHAELVSIAGTYQIHDDFPKGKGTSMCKLQDDELTIEYY